jgi:hypothetical protein
VAARSSSRGRRGRVLRWSWLSREGANQATQAKKIGTVDKNLECECRSGEGRDPANRVKLAPGEAVDLRALVAVKERRDWRALSKGLGLVQGRGFAIRLSPAEGTTNRCRSCTAAEKRARRDEDEDGDGRGRGRRGWDEGPGGTR